MRAATSAAPRPRASKPPSPKAASPWREPVAMAGDRRGYRAHYRQGLKHRSLEQTFQRVQSNQQPAQFARRRVRYAARMVQKILDCTFERILDALEPTLVQKFTVGQT